MTTERVDDQVVLSSRVQVPEHVVYREFAEETVVLNLQSGMYHGLNAVAARMLEVLRESTSVSAAIEELVTEFDQPREVIERDVLALCRSLGERGLIEQNAGPSH